MPAGPRKIWQSLYQIFAKFPTHQYTIFWKKSTQLGFKLGAFYNNLPKIHPICVIWAPLSLMKTPRSLYQISRKSDPKGRHIYVYHVNVRTPPRGLHQMRKDLVLSALLRLAKRSKEVTKPQPVGKVDKQCLSKNIVFQLWLKFNGWQLAKMKKSIPDMSLPWNLKGWSSWSKKVAKILEKLRYLWKCEIWGNIVKIWYFVNNCLIKAWI